MLVVSDDPLGLARLMLLDTPGEKLRLYRPSTRQIVAVNEAVRGLARTDRPHRARAAAAAQVWAGSRGAGLALRGPVPAGSAARE